MTSFIPNRRLFLRNTTIATSAIIGSSLFTTPGLFADILATPAQVEGPFYPDKLPLDTDNDLLILNDKITPAVGTITHLTGKVMDIKGKPIRNARVEIWQCDGNGIYHHANGGDRKKMDRNFQSFGRFMTNMKGEYYFRTIKPVPYPGRTPHIHFKVYTGGKTRLTTQMYINGHDLNATDGVMKSIPNQKLRDLLFVDFKPVKNSKIGELAANFDIVLGQTPNEA